MDDYYPKLNRSIDKGVAYLYHHQYPNGEFCVYIANDAPMKKWTATDSSVFPTALIASSLIFLEKRPLVDETLKKATFFFECQMKKGGLWNHFTNRHPLRNISPYDVDDTALVSSVFKSRNIDWPKPSNIPLLLANRNKSGLFYTWFLLRLRWTKNKTYWKIVLTELYHPVKSILFWQSGEASRNDIDAVVNANVLYYLGENKYTKPIIKHLINIIDEGREDNCDTWYRNPLSVYYFISRNYFIGIDSLKPVREKIIERILKKAKPDGCLGENSLDTALCCCTLMNLKHESGELENAINYLIQNQQETGEWERWILYYGGPKLLLGWGSEELTTGFCLEALERFKNLANKKNI